MFYRLEDGHGLPHDPFKAIVAPRPIGWISSVAHDGSVNLAPYSFFNAVSGKPPIVMFSSELRKDTLENVEETREFACNFVGEPLLKEMSASSASLPRGDNEFDFAHIEQAACHEIKAPRVKAAYACLECKVIKILNLKDINDEPTNAWTVFGQVVGVHIAEEVMTDGRFDLEKAKPAARLGYKDYAVVRDIFELKRPDQA
ncbi:flavin reductase family protein [Ahrensia kielensis]|uniref:flavin reductase family protein n=1 Tax=Ahrensia kielensis TaxID=76980 RepID=UPI00036141CE|nr:flavin reductase family protein [Ahrensia kielensis]